MTQLSGTLPNPGLVRRLLPGAVCLAVYALAGCAATQSGEGPTPAVSGGQPLGASNIPSDTLREPMVLSSVPVRVGPDRVIGIVDVRMTVDTATLPVPRIHVDTVNGVVDTTLIQVPMRLRSYRVTHVNGNPSPDSAPHFPGPTFRVNVGDSVRINLVNDLPAVGTDTACVNYPAYDSGVDSFEDCFHGSNWTNIHYHGFHVTPNKSADDVLLQIAPGDSFQYAFRIPLNQSPGTHFYHPHKHGSVALQVTNGMAGAFFIMNPRSGLDSLSIANGWRECMLALQQVSDTINLMETQPPPSPPTLVNGQYVPTVTMRPGEVQRWRLVDENITSTAKFQVGFIDVEGQDEPDVYDVARDGVQYASANYSTLTSGGYKLQPDTTLLMAPGNRLDVLIQAPMEGGVHLFRATPVHPRGANAASQGSRKGPPPDVLFLLKVEGNPVAQSLPDTLPTLPWFLANLTGPVDTLALAADTTLPVIVFNDINVPGASRSPANPNRFFLGNAQNPFMRFDTDSIYVPTDTTGRQRPMVLGATQIWRVENRGTATDHPFHIHINPFQVLHVVAPKGTGDDNWALYQQLNTAAESGNPIWLDVVPLPIASGGNPGVVYIAQKYDDFDGCQGCGEPTGWFVMHCHILGHEERGMMQVLEIVKPGQTPTPAPASLFNTSQPTGAQHRH
jgi:FtsP/CotA-like multicopper oxidase with cupredoxin domain